MWMLFYEWVLKKIVFKLLNILRFGGLLLFWSSVLLFIMMNWNLECIEIVSGLIFIVVMILDYVLCNLKYWWNLFGIEKDKYEKKWVEKLGVYFNLLVFVK